MNRSSLCRSRLSLDSFSKGFAALGLTSLVLGCSGSEGAGRHGDGMNQATTGGSAATAGGSSSVGGSTSGGSTSTSGGTSGSGAASSSGGTENGGTTSQATGGTSAEGGSSGGTDASGGSGGNGFVPVVCGEGDPVSDPTGAMPTLTPGEWEEITPPGVCEGAHFGCMDIHVHPCNTAVLYVTTDVEGMWRSLDGGATWSEIGNFSGEVSPGVIQINPENPDQMYYIGGVRGSTVGFWKSSDGGDTWSEPAGFTSQANNSVDGWTNDVYDVKADPADFNHVLITFHSGFEWTGNAGVLESTDAGESWERHWPDGWGAGHSVYFLNNSNTWLVGTQGNGYWRTSDAGDNWTKVNDRDMQHGGTDAFYTPEGVLYVGALSNILRSTDNGLTFDEVAPDTGHGYYDVVSDGTHLYAQFANTGSHGTTSKYVVSDVDDGMTWTDFNSQTFTDGPYRMDFDAINGIIYSANWNAGVWALKVEQ